LYEKIANGTRAIFLLLGEVHHSFAVGILPVWKLAHLLRGLYCRNQPITMEDVMNERIKRIYVDNSVISGMFDSNDHPKRAKPFWDAVFSGKMRVVLSDVLDEEVKRAPEHIRDFYRTVSESQIERIDSTDESDTLAEQYVRAGIVSAQSLTDCQHVALASVARVDVLVSFNCTHIVKLNRIHRYNAINMLSDYPQIEIRTPDEVIQ
jgi:predicted nucleic acid-binding protein